MDLVFRAAFGFLFVFLLTRIVGRRELSSLEPFDLILLVMIGDLVQQGITQNDFSVTGMVLVGGTVALMTVLVAWTDFRFPFVRPAIAGRPIIVVEDGKRLEVELQPGDQQTICASGCFVTLPDGDRIGLEGGENVKIVNGSAVVK